jgi:hypothetical protein
MKGAHDRVVSQLCYSCEPHLLKRKSAISAATKLALKVGGYVCVRYPEER